MTPRERVFAALQHQEPDRVPRFEIWIDALIDELGAGDPQRAYVDQGQDSVMLPSQTPPDSNAWRDGVDEFGRVWRDGMYITGVVEDETDLHRYTPPLDIINRLFDPGRARAVRAAYPDHCLMYGTHIGPFIAAYMAMGLDRFFVCLYDDPGFAHRLLANRTEWCIAQFQAAVDLGAEVIVMGDDAGTRSAPMIAPDMWRTFVLPYHRQVVEALDVPVIWHSDGYILPLLPMAVEAGFTGVHGLEPAAGIDLAAVKQEFGRDLVLVGNVDVRVLCASDLGAVRREVDRCINQGALGGGYMIASCNSIFAGMNAAAVLEMFRCQDESLRSE
jgi:uroporphyrinogen decarboxylase